MADSPTPQTTPQQASLSPREAARYARHLALPQVGAEGQRKLKAASVIVVGTGGLGSPISMYLTAAGVGRIGLVDYDVVDTTNLQRQIVHGEHTLGKPKVLSAAARLADLNPHIAIEPYDTPLTSANALEILATYDIIVDGTDNFPTRYLLNDAAVLLGRPLVYGSIYQFEGQASVFGMPDGPCYRCLLPTPPPPGSVPSCSQAGVIGVLPGTIGTIQATEAIKLILGIGETLAGRLLIYDALDMQFDIIRLSKRVTCPACGDNPTITELIDYEEFCGMPSYDRHPSRAGEPGLPEIEPRDLAARLQAGEALTLLDIREPYELLISQLPNARHIPMGTLQWRLDEIPREEPVVVFCRTGIRSIAVVSQLLAAGFSNVTNLRGGIDAWSLEVDPTVPRY